MFYKKNYVTKSNVCDIINLPKMQIHLEFMFLKYKINFLSGHYNH